MSTLKQEQQQKSREAADTDKPYEYSPLRVAEGVTINVVSAVLIGLGAIILGAAYAGWALVLSALHTPDGLVGVIALILLGAMLLLIILVVAIVAWIRGMSSAALSGMLLGAMIGASIGAAIASGKFGDRLEAAAKMAKNAAKTGGG